ncbi:ROK family transcriptional regulator [Microbacterium sp. A588]
MTTSTGPGVDRTVPRPELLASITDASVLAAIRNADEPASRAEIAQATGLSKPAVSTAVARLAARGVLQEVGIRQGRRGGVATLFRIDPDHGRSLAIVIQNDQISVVSRDLAAVVRAEHRAVVAPDSDPARIVAQTNALIADAAREHAARVLAVTVSIADPVDARTDKPAVLERSVFPAALIDPRRDLQLPGGADVVIDNDVNWAALGELREGALRECANFLYVYAGEGLGAGLVLDGRLFRGSSGLAGEIGYLRANETQDITQHLARLGLGTAERYGLDPSRFPGLDDESLTAVVDALARAVANAVIIVNPEAVALGGPLSRIPDFAERLGDGIRSLSIDPPRVIVSESTPLRGAAIEAHRLALAQIGLPKEMTA